jgi:hypothetical protein
MFPKPRRASPFLKTRPVWFFALNCLYDGVDIHIMISEEEDSSRSTRLEQVVAFRIIVGAGRGGMNPQILSSPDLNAKSDPKVIQSTI